MVAETLTASADLRRALLAEAPGTVVRIFDELSGVATLWRSFEDRADHTAFQTYEFCATWLATAGRAEGVRPLIVVVEDDNGAPLMLLPLCRGGSLVRRIAFIGGLEADYQAPLVARDLERRFDARARKAMLDDVLAALPRHDMLVLERLPDVVGGQKNPLCLLMPQPHFEDAFYAELPDDLDAFLRDRCGAKTLQVLRRKRRKLEKAGETRFVVAEDRDEAAAVLDALFAQKSAQYRATGAADILADPGRRAFYAELALDGLASGVSHISALRVDGEIVAAHWGLIDGDRFHYLLPSHTDGELARYSPGETLLIDLFDWCIGRGLRVFDFTIGDESYKLRWSQHRLALYSITLTPTLRGRVLAAAAAVDRRARLAARNSKWLWRLVTALRQRGMLR